MSCSQALSGIAKDCQSSMGGIKRVLLANKDDVAAITLTSGVITAITMADDGGTPPVSMTFKEYLFRRNTGSMTSAFQVSDNGNKFVQTDLVMVFNRLETTKRLEIQAMAHAEAVAIVEDMNGKYWYLGYNNPLSIADGSNAVTGTAIADLNGYNVTLRDNSLELPYEVDEDVIATVL